MRILFATQNSNGSYIQPQNWNKDTPPDGFYQIADGTDETPLTDNGGFAKPIFSGKAITSFIADADAWAAWLASKTPNLETLRAAKLAELDAAAQAAITGGCDVTLTDGTTGHISLTAEDQINLSTAQAAVQAGAAGYPYHLDGALCKIYPSADILAMGKAAVAHILYHTTLCNHLLTWARRATTVEELGGITYGATLPDDLKANMEAIINAASA